MALDKLPFAEGPNGPFADFGVKNLILADRTTILYTLQVTRKPRSPDQVSATVVGVRLTPQEKELLAALVTRANKMLRLSGLPEGVSVGSLIRSLIDRAAVEAGLLSREIAATTKPWATPIDVQSSRVSPKGKTGQVIPPTRYERILASFDEHTDEATNSASIDLQNSSSNQKENPDRSKIPTRYERILASIESGATEKKPEE